MKNYKKLILGCMRAIYAVILIVALMLPSITIKSGTQTISTGMIDLFSSGSIDLNGGSVASNQFYGILVAICFVATPILCVTDKEITKYIGFGVSVILLSLSISYVRQMNLLKDGFGDTVEITNPGITCILITSIFGLVFSIVDISVSFYVPKIVELINSYSKRNRKDTMALLEENKAMLEKGLISEDEYNVRRNKILGE